jgi:CTP:molybdopterin cytidylyltransferase MocA
MRCLPSFLEDMAKRSSPAAQVIPMAGRGQRFVDQGYADPKPLVSVRMVGDSGDDVAAPMIERALSCLPRSKSRVLVVQREHFENERFQKTVDALGARLVLVDRVTEGQACTARIGTEGLRHEEPVLFAPCDTGYVYDAEKVAQMEAGGWDAIAWTARGHLPAIWRPKMYGWTKVENGRIVDVRVKETVPDVPIGEQEVITGTFWFKDLALFLAEEEAMEDADDRVNREFYIDTIIRRMVARGANVGAFTVDKYLPWGTPEELKAFEYYADVSRLLAEPRA